MPHLPGEPKYFENQRAKQINAIKKMQDIKKPSEQKEIRQYRGEHRSISAYNHPNTLKIEKLKPNAV
jgi:hypothetical protein